jgi:integrase
MKVHDAVATAAPATAPQRSSLRGEALEALRQRFPARTVVAAGTATHKHRDEIVDTIFDRRKPVPAPTNYYNRRVGTIVILNWLENFPGSTWQDRWNASPAHQLGSGWTDAVPLGTGSLDMAQDRAKAGVLSLISADVIRPSMSWLVTACRCRALREILAAQRDPGGFERLEARVDPVIWAGPAGRESRLQISTLLAAKGGVINDITVGDCLELWDTERLLIAHRGRTRSLFYSWLRDTGMFPDQAPATLRAINVRAGQVSVEQLVDRYRLRCQTVRDLLVAYLAERQPAMDYTTLEDLSRQLALHFWKDLETHNPGIDSLRLSAATAASWKERLRTKVTVRRRPDGSTEDIVSPRANYIFLLMDVRGFYLDLAQWAAEDPGRWGPWVAPCPIRDTELIIKKTVSRRKARMDQRTRERLPALPLLVTTAHQRLKDAQLRVRVLHDTPDGETFTVLGETLLKPRRNKHPGGEPPAQWVHRADGRRRNLTQEEHRAFWGWAAVEFLRHTGARIEEMLEVSHHSLIQYRTPDTGQLIPLLQIAPSKSDEERLLVVNPELADVLSAVVSRVRSNIGAIPLVTSYDPYERIWDPPRPLLFQWQYGGQARTITSNAIRKAINEILSAAGIVDAAGQPLRYQPHDFRRIFTTEAIANGMPPHIAQLLLGHKSLDTTMGYNAVYPEEIINGHRAYIARRRALRPSEEYRTPTDEEWDDFLGHFERRRVALGDCGRAYGTGCQHEHSCVRCPLLRVDPSQRLRLQEIRDNLTARITEAEQHGWLGEAEGLRVSLAAAEDKLAQLDARTQRGAINLGIPTFGEIATTVPKPHRGHVTLPGGGNRSDL